MRRVRIEPRPDWRAIVSAQGLVYCETLHPDGEVRPYWEDGAYYAFAPEEIRELERVSAELVEGLLRPPKHHFEVAVDDRR